MLRDRTSNESDRQTNNLAAIAAVLIVVVVSLIIVRKLQVRYMLESCLMYQTPGCEAVIDRLRVSTISKRVLGW